MGLPPGKVDEFNMMSTHPRTIDRVKEATKAAEVQRPTDPRVGRDEYLAKIDGMLFGDDPEQGIVVGSRFVHPELGFEFTVPAGFRIQNDPQQVVALEPTGAAIVFDLAPVRKARTMRSFIRYEWVPDAPLRGLKPLTVDGLEGASAWTAVDGRHWIVSYR